MGFSKTPQPEGFVQDLAVQFRAVYTPHPPW